MINKKKSESYFNKYTPKITEIATYLPSTALLNIWNPSLQVLQMKPPRKRSSQLPLRIH